ncbi:ArgK/MeaB family GTPase [Fodinicurvata sediminis]|uniref:ArgK/MeaB family GTPase n=1 Tax=Fodinicurvata sediminis TaxID=1121832 RepID=UPI0003B60B51|nr:GTP-binding protein [Fodinicurvata sediminis]
MTKGYRDHSQIRGKAAIAQALAAVERHADAVETRQMLAEAYRAPKGHVIGITGPPGVGKSTLIRGLIESFRQEGLSVAVVAVDPSSRQSGGALLGDRVRLGGNPEDSGLFIRSMAARDRLGGLADVTWAATVLLRAHYERILVETVGVGQSETDVANLADSVVFCVQPGSGDVLQFMKAGIAETPHLAVVTKADMGSAAHKTEMDLREALPPRSRDGSEVSILRLALQEPDGIEPLRMALENRWATLCSRPDRLAIKRLNQAEHWLEDALRNRFGREGVKRCVNLELSEEEVPFDRLAELSASLARNWPNQVDGA